jgi:hypothetical protein
VILVKRKIMTVLSALLLALPLLAEHRYELGDGLRLSLGGDVRLRWEIIDRNVPRPNVHDDGPDIQYLRVRSRVWANMEMLDPQVKLNLRLANRVHFTSSRPGDNENGAAHWEFPDEVVLDLANIELFDLLGENSCLRIGRQELGFAYGMLLADGTPFDQGRTVYHDGISYRHTYEKHQATLFTFYDSWKDHSVFINDRNRRLTIGDIFTAGIYYTYSHNPEFNLDLYYMYNDVNDDVDDLDTKRVMTYWPLDSNLSLHTVGARLFGQALPLLGYSMEMAKQGGYNALGEDNQGFMFDARITINAPKDTPMTPSLGLEYMFLSGDRNDTGKNEGWFPLMSSAALWGDDLLPIQYNGFWSNMHMASGEITLIPLEALKVKFGAAFYQADTSKSTLATHDPANDGDYIGMRLFAFVNYKVNDWLSLATELAHFNPGDYHHNGHSSVWARFQTVLTF